MNLIDQVNAIDAKIAKGNWAEAASDHFDSKVESHVQYLIHHKGKSASRNLERFSELIGDGGSIELLANRVIEEDSTSVSLFSLEGAGDADTRIKLLLLVARKFNDAGKIVEEEYLPVRSSADAQTYFPETRLPAKQVQPRLSFITPSRKRRAKGGGRPPKPALPTDLHRIPTIGKTVIDAFNNVGIKTFESLSNAKDEILEQVRSLSGRRFVNFDSTYWREAAKHAFKGEFDKIPAPPKAAKKVGKREAKIDFTTVGDTELHKLPKVGPNLLNAFHEENIHTFSDLAHANEETLERIRIKGGRPFVNFDMSYFPKAAQKKLDGAKSIAAPPKPVAKVKGSGKGKGGRKPREINPNDLHILPGAGKQLIQALHSRDIHTFSDVANADREVLLAARNETKGKYKNIDLGFFQRQAKYAAAGKFAKLDKVVKIEKTAKVEKLSPEARLKAKLASASKNDLQVLPGIGQSVKEAMNAAGINTFYQLSIAKPEKLQEIAANAGKRYAKFDVEFWRMVGGLAHAGEFDQIPAKPPVAAKPKPSGKKRGGQKGPRTARPPREPRDSKDLGALPTIGATLINQLNQVGINTFHQLSVASEAKLEEVKLASGPKYKTFDTSYWKQIAALAKDGIYEYPPAPKKEKKVKSVKRGRAKKPVANTDLHRLANVGPAFARELRAVGLDTFEAIAEANPSTILEAASNAGRRFKNIKADSVIKSAKNAIAGKFTAPTKRKAKANMPEGADKFTELPGIGAKVQSKLWENNIKSYSDLANAAIGTLEQIRDEVGKRVAKQNVRNWKEMARLATQGEWSKIDSEKFEDSAPAKPVAKRPAKPADGDDLTKIKGILPSAQLMFRSRGVKTYQDLLNLSDDELMSLLEESTAKVDPKDFEKVREAAAKQLSKSSKPTAPKAKAADAPKAKTAKKAAPKAKAATAPKAKTAKKAAPKAKAADAPKAKTAKKAAPKAKAADAPKAKTVKKAAPKAKAADAPKAKTAKKAAPKAKAATAPKAKAAKKAAPKAKAATAPKAKTAKKATPKAKK